MIDVPRSLLVRDLLLGGLVAAVAEIEVFALDASKIEGNPLGLHIANALLVPAIGLRRTSPIASILVAAIGFGALSALAAAPVATPFLALLFLLGSLGWYASTRTGLLGVGATLLAGMTWDVLAAEFNLADLLVNSILIALAWAGVHLLRRATDRRTSAEIQADRAAREAAANERERISRDLHDSLAHALTLITLQAGSARERPDGALAQSTLEGIERTGREALADLHRFLHLLGPGDGEAQGLAHIETLAEGVRRNGIDVTVDVDANDLPSSVATTLFRVVQEGLTNAVRHSNASHINVAVHRDSSAVTATVHSTGPARPASVPGSGRGLKGLRRRVELFAGELDTGPTPTGWKLEARIPLGAVS